MVSLTSRETYDTANFQRLASLLKQCGAMKDLTQGKQIHSHIIRTGLHNNLLLNNLLLQMYLNCGSVVDVHDAFLGMYNKNKFSWNFYITSNARHGQHDRVMYAFHQMLCECILPNEFIFAGTISSCARNSALQDGKHMHAHVIEGHGRESNNIVIENALVNMYCRCNMFMESKRIFNEMQVKNVVTWTDMILACAHHESENYSIMLYKQMHQEGVIANKVTFINILEACAFQQSPMEGKQIHVSIIGNGLESEVMLVTSLLNMYTKCNNTLRDALALFEWSSNRNIVLWTTMIAGCSQQGHGDMANQFFERMMLEGMLPDEVTYACAVDACTSRELLMTGKRIHASIHSDEIRSNIVLGTSLLNMYLKCGCLKIAREMFDEMEERNLLTWTSLITSYVYHGYEEQAILFHVEMQRQGILPDKSLLWTLVDACSCIFAIEKGKHVHYIIVLFGIETDPSLAAGLINFYGKCGKLDAAQFILDKLPEGNLVAWTAMITSYAQHRQENEAFLLYEKIQSKGFSPNKVTFVCILSAVANAEALSEGRSVHAAVLNSEFYGDVMVMTALVNMYGKCSCEEDARKTFDEIQQPNVISWNTMLSVYSQCNSTLQLFEQMQQEKILPNKVTFVIVLDACASIETLRKGSCIHSLAIQMGFDIDLDVQNAIINMYSKCGMLAAAHKVFDQMCEWDIISWNIIIRAFSQHGQSKRTLLLFEEMVGHNYPPDGVTFVSVLSSCGHEGLVLDGCNLFFSIRDEYGIIPLQEHYHCMIHMLAKAGLIEKAMEFINTMPIQQTYVTWMALISTYKDSPNMAGGECVVRHMIELDEENASTHVMLSNMYVLCTSAEQSWSLNVREVDEIVYQTSYR